MKLTRRIISLGSALIMAVSLMSFGVGAQWTRKQSGGGTLPGYIKYYFNVDGKHYGSGGVDFYYLQATTTQEKIGGVVHPVDLTAFSATIRLASGGTNTSSGTSGTMNSTWSSNSVLNSAVTSNSNKGDITTTVYSVYYGSITNIKLTNQSGYVAY